MSRSPAPPPVRRYIQLTFSGCAGEAEISSAVAAHWAERWYREDLDTLSPALSSRGFTPRVLEEPPSTEPTFLPVGALGYAAYEAAGTSEEADPRFVLDAWVRGGHPDEAAALVAMMEARYGSLMSDGHCRCQLWTRHSIPHPSKSWQPRAGARSLTPSGVDARSQALRQRQSSA